MHVLREAAGQRKAQAEAAVTSRDGAVDLTEGVPDACETIRCDARPVVAHLDAHAGGTLLHRGFDPDLDDGALGRELRRVVHETVDDLHGPARIAESGRDVGGRAEAQLAKTGYDPDFGARPLKRVIQREVADPIALELLKGTYQSGDAITVDAQPDGGLAFSGSEATAADLTA